MTNKTGETIRAIRRKQGKTQLDVARQCDCTISFLSKLEHGHTHASLNMLHRIAQALHVNISTLLPSRPGGSSRVVRAKDRLIVDNKLVRSSDGVHLETISVPGIETIFQVNLHYICVGGRSDGQITHEGEEFVHVLNGCIELHLGDETYQLEHGDSAFFPSNEPHGYVNKGEIPAVVLWLNSPPTY